MNAEVVKLTGAQKKEQAAYDTALNNFSQVWNKFKDIEFDAPNEPTILVNRVSELENGKKTRYFVYAYKNQNGLIGLEANKAVFDHQTQLLGKDRTRENWGKGTETYEFTFGQDEIKIKTGKYFKYMSPDSWNADLNLEIFLRSVDDMAVAETITKKTEALVAVTEWLQPQTK